MSTLSAHTQMLGSSSQGGNNQPNSMRQFELYRQVELKRQMHLNILDLLQRQMDPMVAA
ncbi:hypothetical protein IMZ48_38875 [Candidatus Bathyarchaeota archaeon]|nr:hypothetical protein [Candidatus Bathyarchaeota archaeon]